uniref:V-set and transmembrane domain containing 4a n=1 Tax=Oryzias sinensis TaxID=183150 RepID=A0A8C7YHR5_9TELE
MYFSVVVLVLTKALLTEVCQALNVTVTPGPVVLVTEKDNLTLSCLVSQRKRSNSFLILRWFFSPLPFPSLAPPSSPPPTSSPTLDPSQFLIVKTGIRKLKLYGNYTRRFPHPKFHLHDEEGGEIYRLLILNLTGMDQGFYSCKVQEIRKYRNTWRSSSNGTSTIQLKVHFTPEDGSGEGLWILFAGTALTQDCLFTPQK